MEGFIWKIHPARESWARTTAVSALIVLVGVLSAMFMEHAFYFFFAVTVLFLGLGSYFLPTTWGVNEDGVVKKIAGQKWGKPWSFFRRFKVTESGIFLSPMAKAGVLDRFQGWFLPVKDEKIRGFIITKMETTINGSSDNVSA